MARQKQSPTYKKLYFLFRKWNTREDSVRAVEIIKEVIREEVKEMFELKTRSTSMFGPLRTQVPKQGCKLCGQTGAHFCTGHRGEDKATRSYRDKANQYLTKRETKEETEDTHDE